MHVRLSPPGPTELGEFLSRLSEQPLSYPEVGATTEPTLPAGYRHDRHDQPLGEGDMAFGRGCEALRGWQAHRHAGAVVSPPNAALVAGAEVIVTLHVGPFLVLAPCRIVYVTNDPDRFGFAYGTLPGHPEQGEEAFHVVRSADDAVTFEVVAFSRPADRLAQIGAPVARTIQKRVTMAYLEGVRRFVGGT